jgi:hypothetical protein
MIAKNSRLLPLALGLLAAWALTAPAAQAFTFENSDQANGTPQGYVDLDTKAITQPTKPGTKLDDNGTYKQGNFYLNFGADNTYRNNNYDPSNLFNPDYAPNR